VAQRVDVTGSSAWLHELLATTDRALARLVTLPDAMSQRRLVEDLRALRARLLTQIEDAERPND
jgi:hypothetical protein